jgi:hypothetical protein
MTEASVRALSSLRDLSMLKWYAVPLLGKDVAALLVIGAKRVRTKAIAVGNIYGTAIALNVSGYGVMGCNY